MKKRILTPLVFLFSIFSQVALAVPKVAPEKEADFMFGLMLVFGESIPYSYLLENINNQDSQAVVETGYQLCDKLIELTSQENISSSEVLQIMSEDDDQELREYAQIGQVAIAHLCPYLK
jgi:hypothetical protein